MTGPHLIRRRVTWLSAAELRHALKRHSEAGVDLARRAGVTKGAAYAWLTGRTVISEAQALRMREWYGVEVRLQTHVEPTSRESTSHEAQ